MEIGFEFQRRWVEGGRKETKKKKKKKKKKWRNRSVNVGTFHWKKKWGNNDVGENQIVEMPPTFPLQ